MRFRFPNRAAFASATLSISILSLAGVVANRGSTEPEGGVAKPERFELVNRRLDSLHRGHHRGGWQGWAESQRESYRRKTMSASILSSLTRSPVSSLARHSLSSGPESASAPTPSSPAVAVETLATGRAFGAGSITSTLRWQASGLLTRGCPTGVARLAIDTCFHMYLNATGDLQGAVGAATERREFDAEADAGQFDGHLAAYFDVFPDQVPGNLASHPDGLSRHKRQISSCADQIVSAVVPTTYTTFTTVTSPLGVRALAVAATATVLQPTDALAGNTFATVTTVVSSTTVRSAVSASITPSSPRQRIELLSWPGAAAGQTWSYTWKSFQDPATGTGNKFFHAWQLLRRDFCGGPVVTLDYKAGHAVIRHRSSLPQSFTLPFCSSETVFWKNYSSLRSGAVRPPGLV